MNEPAPSRALPEDDGRRRYGRRPNPRERSRGRGRMRIAAGLHTKGRFETITPRRASGGWVHSRAQLWSPAGVLVATSTQTVAVYG